MEDRVTIDRIARACAKLGVREGGVLLVHSSFRSLGKVPGGVETLLVGLRRCLGEEGTLLIPALSYEYVTPRQPFFSLMGTPSNIGAVPEYTRQRPGVIRSLHPTHSVCGMGPQAKALLLSHGLDSTPCGPHSPFHLLPKYGGQILMLGCGLRPNTSMHAIEERLRPPYLLDPPMDYTLVLGDGRKIRKPYFPHNFRGYRQRYDRVRDVLATPDLRFGRILQADSYLIEAKALWEKAYLALQENPFYFVEVVPPLL